MIKDSGLPGISVFSSVKSTLTLRTNSACTRFCSLHQLFARFHSEDIWNLCLLLEAVYYAALTRQTHCYCTFTHLPDGYSTVSSMGIKLMNLCCKHCILRLFYTECTFAFKNVRHWWWNGEKFKVSRCTVKKNL